MRHEIVATKCGVRLRPVVSSDASRIVELRNSDHARGCIQDGARNVSDQEKWIEEYLNRESDYSFMIETVHDNRSVGMLGIYGITGVTGEWGRWVIEPGVPVAAASAWLALHICFDVLELNIVRGMVVEHNKEVISFHRRAGYRLIGFDKQSKVVGGKVVRMVEFELTRNEWPETDATLMRYAVMAQEYVTKPGHLAED